MRTNYPAVSALFAIALFAPMTNADSKLQLVQPLIGLAEELNEKCRGGSGDQALTHEYCSERDSVIDELKQAGWCPQKTNPRDGASSWGKCPAPAGSAISTEI